MNGKREVEQTDIRKSNLKIIKSTFFDIEDFILNLQTKQIKFN